MHLSVLILEVQFGTGLVRHLVRRGGGFLSCLHECGVVTPPSLVP